MSNMEYEQKSGHPVLAFVFALLGIIAAVLLVFLTGVIGGGIALALGVAAVLIGIAARRRGLGIAAIICGTLAVILAVIMTFSTVAVFRKIHDEALKYKDEAPLVAQCLDKPHFGFLGMIINVTKYEGDSQQLVDQFNMIKEKVDKGLKDSSSALPWIATAQAAESEDEVLRVAVLYDISTMDVSKTTDDYLIPMNVFDRLFETRPVNGKSEIVKSLITDYSVSADGLTYDFVLREGIVFSNGSALTASDVQYSFERLLKAARENTDIPLEIKGGEAVMKGEAQSLEGFSIKDDTHFSVTLNAPNAGFPAELSAPAASIVDAETTEKAAAFGTDPADAIGTGPYIVTEWVSNDHYTLVYNDKYWGPKPSVKKLIVRVIADPMTQNLMFQNGELDIINLQYLDSAIVAATYKNKPADRIASTPNVGETFLLMNEENPYLKDVKVRKAIGMAIDVDLIIQSIFSGDAQRENCMIPTGVWAHNDQQEGYTYDPEAAKALLKEAGYAENEVKFELSMDSSADSGTQLVYASISEQLKKVGIQATVASYDHSSWLAKRSSGTMDSFVGRWGMDYNDPANIVFTFFGSEESNRGRSINYPDKSIFARVAAARTIVDDQEREKEYQELDRKLIREDAVWIPMYSTLHMWCLGDRVASFTPHWAGFSDFYAADVVLK